MCVNERDTCFLATFYRCECECECETIVGMNSIRNLTVDALASVLQTVVAAFTPDFPAWNDIGLHQTLKVGHLPLSHSPSTLPGRIRCINPFLVWPLWIL